MVLGILRKRERLLHWVTHEVAFSLVIKCLCNPRWTPPLGFCNLKFDGSTIGNLGLGGIIWDKAGETITAFSSPVGFGSVNKVELKPCE